MADMIPVSQQISLILDALKKAVALSAETKNAFRLGVGHGKIVEQLAGIVVTQDKDGLITLVFLTASAQAEADKAIEKGAEKEAKDAIDKARKP